MNDKPWFVWMFWFIGLVWLIGGFIVPGTSYPSDLNVGKNLLLLIALGFFALNIFCNILAFREYRRLEVEN